jgi:hypothetical protein
VSHFRSDRLSHSQVMSAKHFLTKGQLGNQTSDESIFTCVAFRYPQYQINSKMHSLDTSILFKTHRSFIVTLNYMLHSRWIIVLYWEYGYYF